MTKLKLRNIPDEKPVKVTMDLPAGVRLDLADYAMVLGRQSSQKLEPKRLIGPMLAHFMATDGAFASSRRTLNRQGGAEPPLSDYKP